MSERLDELLSLIDRFYESAAERGGWDAALEATCRVLDGEAVVFLVHDRACAKLPIGRLWGRPLEAMREYERDFLAFDVGVDDLLELGVGTVLTEQHVAASVRRRNPFFGDFRPKWSIERYLAGAVFSDERRFGVLAVQGSASRTAFGEDDATFLKRLLPHVTRAVHVGAQLEGAEQAAESFENLCEHIATGVILLGDDGSVHFANAAARRVLERGDGLITRGRELVARQTADTRAIREAVAAARSVVEREGSTAGQALAVNRHNGRLPYSVLVTPGRFLRGCSEGNARVLVLVGDPAYQMRSPLETISDLYGLTRAEAELVRSLASGDSIDGYADRAGIAVSTARWRLKQVQSKMGVRRQPELVHLLLTGPAALVPPDC